MAGNLENYPRRWARYAVCVSVLGRDEQDLSTKQSRGFGRHMMLRLALVIWTVGIWGSRVRNIFEDEELVGGERIAALVVALFLVIAAVLVGVSMLRSLKWHGQALGVLVLAGVARFTIRGVAILASSEWDVGFKVVHTVLWAVTVILSLTAAREFSKVRSGAWVSS